MATPDARQIIRLDGGSLCIDPTDLATDYPHGGTALGLIRDGEFRYGERARLVHAEEFGRVAVEGFRIQESPVLSAVFRTWDDDVLSNIFPDTTAGTSGGRVIRGNVSANAQRGGNLSDLAVTLCFSPRSPDQHPFILIYSAIPVFIQTPAFGLRVGEEVGTAVGFYGIPDASGRLYQVADRGDADL